MPFFKKINILLFELLVYFVSDHPMGQSSRKKDILSEKILQK